MVTSRIRAGVLPVLSRRAGFVQAFAARRLAFMPFKRQNAPGGRAACLAGQGKPEWSGMKLF
jgi:hypothetical protein